ncbi:MAG: amino acid ABC transporter permease [Ectothiorhodospiraceae bacterium]|nr:amino acid ABC transporter permease [Ectothiorhodospiraceae bacterium]
MHRIRAGFVIALCAFLGGCASSEKWGWYVISPTTRQGRVNIEFLLSGVGWTIALTVCCVALSIVLGFVLFLPRIPGNRWLDALNRAVVELLRSIPPLVSILWVYYGLPVLTGIDLGPFVSGMVALSLYGAAFMAEIYRGGVQSIERGQFEAADSLALSTFDKMRYVIFPQALRRSLPAMGNQFVIILKMSSLVSVIGLTEVVRRANELAVTEYRPLEIYTFLVLEYLVLVLLLSAGVRWVERRLGADEGGAASPVGRAE